MFCVRGNKILILYVNIEFDLRKMVIYYIEKKFYCKKCSCKES